MSDQPNEEARPVRRQPTLRMATLAVQNMISSASNETNRSSIRDLASEMLLPISSVLLIAAICVNAQPLIKAACFILPLAALAYYLYRRIGVISTFSSRQAYMTRCLLLATFMMGGTFALFFIYIMAYILEVVVRVH